MAHFIHIKVKDIVKDTPQSVVLTLDIAENNRKEFRYSAGQYLTFRHKHGGEDLRRSYSICVGEGANDLRVGIKKVNDGVFSTFANDVLKCGDELEVMAPMGNFVLGGASSKRFLMVAAGSGITPILSHIETILTANTDTYITLIYGNKSPHSTMFRERLEELKNKFIERFAIIYVFSAASQDIELFSGRIDGNKCIDILKKWIGQTIFDHVFICGPEQMIQNVQAGIQTLGIEKSKIKYELFATVPHKSKNKVTTKKSQQGTEISVVLDGTEYEINIRDGESVLDAARRQNLDAPFSCKGGICSTCRCKILEGSGEMKANQALEDYEVEQGYALSCQLIPTSNKIKISYDSGH